MSEDSIENLTEHLTTQPQKQLTEAQFRKLRGQYFTIRHHRVRPCNHLLDQINEPTFRNCQSCWFCFFSSHGELVQVTDKAMQEQGAPFLDKMRGRTYRKMFCAYMSTLARLKRESDEQAREIQSGGGLGQSDGQGERGVDDLSKTRESSEPAGPFNFDGSNLAG